MDTLLLRFAALRIWGGAPIIERSMGGTGGGDATSVGVIIDTGSAVSRGIAMLNSLVGVSLHLVAVGYALSDA